MTLTQISANLAVVASGLVLFLFALPSIIGAIKSVGIVRTLIIIFGLSVIVIGFELIAVKTSLPYGKFSYSSVFGQQIMGSVPWLVALAYTPVVLGSFWLSTKIARGFLAVILSSLITTSAYLVTSPAMTKLTLWQWENNGPFYGVPLRAFIGWFVLAFLSALFVSMFWGNHEQNRKLAISLLSIMLFWTGVNLGVGVWISAILGLIISIVLIVPLRADRRQEA